MPKASRMSNGLARLMSPGTSRIWLQFNATATAIIARGNAIDRIVRGCRSRLTSDI
jgi:hypothetical protein